LKYVSLVIIFVLIILLALFGKDIFNERIDPLVEKEVEVVQGERAESQMFHGRMYRWQYAWKNFQDVSLISWLLGYSISLESPFFNISIGIHNDYLRIFYFTGIIGAICYLLFLFRIWRRKRAVLLPERYLLYGTMAILYYIHLQQLLLFM